MVRLLELFVSTIQSIQKFKKCRQTYRPTFSWCLLVNGYRPKCSFDPSKSYITFFCNLGRTMRRYYEQSAMRTFRPNLRIPESPRHDFVCDSSVAPQIYSICRAFPLLLSPLPIEVDYYKRLLQTIYTIIVWLLVSCKIFYCIIRQQVESTINMSLTTKVDNKYMGNIIIIIFFLMAITYNCSINDKNYFFNLHEKNNTSKNKSKNYFINCLIKTML